ncbi:hypothetical protein QYF36_014641 [Acer negundo]|nr:hypothetical protein QYF36_014641 [Acer negundo]
MNRIGKANIRLGENIYIEASSKVTLIVSRKIASPQTCPADLSTKCADSGEWEGEFFPGIPTIKYEGPTS